MIPFGAVCGTIAIFPIVPAQLIIKSLGITENLFSSLNFCSSIKYLNENVLYIAFCCSYTANPVGTKHSFFNEPPKGPLIILQELCIGSFSHPFGFVIGSPNISRKIDCASASRSASWALYPSIIFCTASSSAAMSRCSYNEGYKILKFFSIGNVIYGIHPPFLFCIMYGRRFLLRYMIKYGI